jgi:Mg/Co/Ni transporter MgtE
MCQRHYLNHLPGLACTIAFTAVLLLAGSAPLYSQTRPAPPPPPPDDKVFRDKDDLGSDIGSHESEMRAKLALSRDKKLYDENLARAKETSEIASQLLESYHAKKSLSSEDQKKLERIEKLVRRVRNEAGGTETDIESEVSPVMETAMKSVADMAEELRKEVEKTPRHVISTAVIDQANKLIGLIQHVRDLNR